MANRNRNIQIKFNVSEEEKALIDKRQKQSGIENKGAFYRKMLIDGYVVKTDVALLKEITVGMSRIGNNVNQIARVANQNGRVSQKELQLVMEKLDELWQLVKSIVSSQL